MSVPNSSIFNLFTIGIGPSSSHTMGPMKAARQFVLLLENNKEYDRTVRIKVDLFGSLALTGKGHGTDKAVLLGLSGEQPHRAKPNETEPMLAEIRKSKRLKLTGKRMIRFNEKDDLVFNYKETLPAHSNGIRFTALDDNGSLIRRQTYYSIGGGVVLTEEEAEKDTPLQDAQSLPRPFSSAKELLEMGEKHGESIYEMVLVNEKCWHTEAEIREKLLHIWQVMQDCVKIGCHTEGILPGGLNVRRRAPIVFNDLVSNPERALRDPLSIIDWVNLYALAVNEENAAGGRVVTAPTNGAAGIIPAVLHYFKRFTANPTDDGIIRFLLTAGAIGLLYKQNASISGAEVGCQGEVGVACSMAAGGLVAALGGGNRHVESAAEIGMEHNLGLTCDPVGGLVQIPCIERNAMGAIKAINASRISMQGDGSHMVSLDQVIATMRETGKDMKSHYKETAQGGLAVNVIEC